MSEQRVIERVLGPSRRLWLAGTTAALVGCSSEEPRAGLLGVAERWNRKVQGTLFRPHIRARQLPASYQTAADDFPVYHLSDAVPVPPPGWRLKVGGAVRHPVSLSLQELQSMTRTDIRVRHYCVEGWSAVASWHGVRISDIAQRVAADPRARFVEFRSFDNGYWSSWDRPSALHDQSILAYGMNGRPLSPAHGAPLRVYAGVKLGYKQVKYLTEVRFLPEETGGYWENQGYEWYAGV